MTQPKLHLQHPVYPELTQPSGFLHRNLACQACWYYYTLAQKNKEKVGDSIDDQIIYEGDLWQDKRYVQIARSVALLFGFESPEPLFKSEWWDLVKKQAADLGLPEPAAEYMNPRRFFN